MTLTTAQGPAVIHEYARSDAVSMSPHIFLTDGTNVANPGPEGHWQGEWAKGFPVVDNDNPIIYEHILRAAAEPEPAAP